MNRTIKYILAIVLVSSLASCKKWLELKPQDGIVRESFWQTKEQVNAAVTGIYASMLGSGMPELFFIWGEARTDMVSPAFRANQDELDIVNLNMLPTNQFTNWRSFYQTINFCNTVIELAPGVRDLDNTFSQAHLDRAVGEALAIRALMYFYLVRNFGEVPLKLNATISDQDIVTIPKVGRDTILNQIVADLKQAEPGLPVSYGNVDTDKGRVTKYSVNAILADVYLWMDKYTECVAECDKIINSQKFGLVSGREIFFEELFFNGNSVESIFELQYETGFTNPFYAMHIASTRRWSAAPHLTEDVYGIDLINLEPIVDMRGDGAAYSAASQTIWKYIGASRNGTTARSLDQSIANWIFYRYADVLLMKAEALNETDKPLEASRLVKVIRQRANAVDFKEAMDSTSQSSMVDFILEERQREFAYEGKRWYDVLRNAKRKNYQRLDLLLSMAAISVASDRQQAAFNKLRDFNSHYLPIYFYEITTNDKLIQNPFYK